MSAEVKNNVKHIIDSLENPEAQDWYQEYMEENNGATPSAMDYLEDALDIEYIVNSQREYLGARVLVAFGGPNIWINTRTMQVEGYWWGDSSIESFTDNLGLDETLQELWEMGA